MSALASSEACVAASASVFRCTVSCADPHKPSSARFQTDTLPYEGELTLSNLTTSSLPASKSSAACFAVGPSCGAASTPRKMSATQSQAAMQASLQ